MSNDTTSNSDGLAPGDDEQGEAADPETPDTTSGGAPEPANTTDPAAFGRSRSGEDGDAES
ncbi:hypothetical protein WDJ51_08285 [Rathayibacter sp. YIM 133350]|uniref:hypothetical protein n=1 Tax=Rathayibacter sp. YIM 133350 TaxID=3131992 RepID=UPI00307E5EC1